MLNHVVIPIGCFAIGYISARIAERKTRGEK